MTLGRVGPPRDVVVPGRERLELVEVVRLAREVGVVLPWRTDLVDAVLDRPDLRAVRTGEARRAWFARLGEDARPPEDAVAALLEEQARRVEERAEERARDDADAGAQARRAALSAFGAAEVLIELDVALALGPTHPDRIRAWVGAHGEAAVSLATLTGVDVELAWGAVGALPEMLAHLVRLPATTRDADPEDDRAPLGAFTLPVELMAAADTGERRDDLLPALAARFPGGSTRDGAPVDAAGAAALAVRLRDGLTARLRAVVRRRDDSERAGLVVWLRVEDRWFSLTPGRTATGVALAQGRAVDPRDLARDLGPVLAGVWGRDAGAP
ncbi:hypothetical protein [Nocardioides sp.]|uniref:hypothetical protein n=1 Tax=Nocardioides sp. TaxID=35761 RepID=UPI0035127FF9